jgi:hypothetical protein
MHLKEAWADSHRVFQLKIHQAVPGTMPVEEESFCGVSGFEARNGLAVAGYRIPADTSFTRQAQRFLGSINESIRFFSANPPIRRAPPEEDR